MTHLALKSKKKMKGKPLLPQYHLPLTSNSKQQIVARVI